MHDFAHRPTLGMTVLLALVATAGWGDTPPPTPRKEPARRASTKPDTLAQRLCDALHTLPAARKKECCGTTLSSLAGVCTQELSASLRSGAVTLDPAQIDRCAVQTAKQLEGCDWVTPLVPRPPDACLDVVHGQRKAGTRCRSSVECLDGLFCRAAAPGREGVCAAPRAARTRCDVPADNLAAFTRAEDDGRHLGCEGLCIKGQCLPFSPAGGRCQSSAACMPGLHCISGQCQDRPLPKIGESCAGSTSCGAGAYCEAGRCAALKNEGESCTLPTECRAIECVVAPGATAGKCGNPCGLSSRPPVKPAAPAH